MNTTYRHFSRWIRWAMQISDSVSEWNTNRWLRKEEKRGNTSNSWVTPERQRALICAYGLGLLLWQLVVILLFVSKLFSLLFLPIIVLILVAWMLLRRSIRWRDGAPRALLDEYEQKVLDRARTVSNSILLFGGVLLCWALIYGGSWPDHGISKDWVYALGCQWCVVLCVAASLPAASYAFFLPSGNSDDDAADGTADDASSEFEAVTHG